MNSQTINKPRTVVYTSLGFVTALTDLKIVIKPPSGTAPTVTFVEQGLGIYVATYTPTIIGIYQEHITSVLNFDNAVDAYMCMSADDSDLQTQLTTMQTSINKILSSLNRGGTIN